MPSRRAGPTISAMGRIAVVGWDQETNFELVTAWRELGLPALLLTPPEAMDRLEQDDVALGRLDVATSLDGVEPGVDTLGFLEHRGVRVLNRAGALMKAHDKLLTAHRLDHAAVPSPRTVFVPPGATNVLLPAPLVLKPRFGSWGVDVLRCDAEADVAPALELLRTRPWFHRRGAIAQTLIEPRGYDLRLLVAGGVVVGSAERRAAPGEWRTNVSLGGSRRPVDAPPAAARLGVAAAAAIGTDFVGIDLVPTNGGHIVLELNGAVEFDNVYDLPGHDVYLDVARELELAPVEVAV